MDIILQCKGKANGHTEKFTDKPDNISTEQVRRYALEDEHSEDSKDFDKA